MPSCVLVVDDDVNMRSLLGYCLEKNGYEVELSGDGLDALERGGAERPDLILLDLGQPQLDSLAFLTRWRDLAGLRTVPVLVLTGDGSREFQNRCRALGAVGFVPKPFSPRQLLVEVARILGDEPPGSGAGLVPRADGDVAPDPVLGRWPAPSDNSNRPSSGPTDNGSGGEGTGGEPHDLLEALRTRLAILTLLSANLDTLYERLGDDKRQQMIRDLRRHSQALNGLFLSLLEGFEG
jgi:CheY-like chemotaxis protein